MTDDSEEIDLSRMKWLPIRSTGWWDVFHSENVLNDKFKYEVRSIGGGEYWFRSSSPTDGEPDYTDKCDTFGLNSYDLFDICGDELLSMFLYNGDKDGIDRLVGRDWIYTETGKAFCREHGYLGGRGHSKAAAIRHRKESPGIPHISCMELERQVKELKEKKQGAGS